MSLREWIEASALRVLSLHPANVFRLDAPERVQARKKSSAKQVSVADILAGRASCSFFRKYLSLKTADFLRTTNPISARKGRHSTARHGQPHPGYECTLQACESCLFSEEASCQRVDPHHRREHFATRFTFFTFVEEKSPVLLPRVNKRQNLSHPKAAGQQVARCQGRGSLSMLEH